MWQTIVQPAPFHCQEIPLAWVARTAWIEHSHETRLYGRSEINIKKAVSVLKIYGF